MIYVYFLRGGTITDSIQVFMWDDAMNLIEVYSKGRIYISRVTYANSGAYVYIET